MGRAKDPSLRLIAIRLRTDDIERAKRIAARERRPYQQWVRERVAEAVRAKGELHTYKISTDGGVVVVMAESATQAVALAEAHGKALETELSYPAGALVRWIRQAEVHEAQVKPGVVAWAQAGFARRV